jgi:hypothetical protein
MLDTLKIKKGLDKEGREVMPVVELMNGLTSHPKRFACRGASKRIGQR